MTDRPRLDRIDLKILSRLQRDARITNHRLAESIGLSPSACLQRVRKLEAAGIIAAYGASLDLDKVCRSVTVLASVTLRRHAKTDFGRFEAALREIPEIVECRKVSGGFDYLLRFVCPDMARYHALSEELLGAGPGVANLSSHVVLEEAKAFTGYPLEKLV